MRKILALLLVGFTFTSVAVAQQIKGKVNFIEATGEKVPASFANVWWMEGKEAAETDIDGNFSFKKIKGEDITLIATFIGYTRDTVVVARGGETLVDATSLVFNLKSENELESLVVTGKQEGNYLSKTAQIKTEVITAAGLCKMACCSLAESFETSASVSVGYSDAVTGAKQIKLLGLSGSYTQMLDENKPIMRGLASPFGLSYIPGQWLESIQIAKGPSSVINGLEAMTGQINMEHRKPTAENPLFVNLFMNSNLRLEANVASSIQINDHWSTVLQGHVSGETQKHDANKDGFRDDPTTRQFNIDNRWLYFVQDGVQIRFGFKYLDDKRIGGMMEYEEGMNKRNIFSSNSNANLLGDAFANNIWGNEIHNNGASGFFKLGIPIGPDGDKNIAFVGDFSYYKMKSSYGLKDFNGKQYMGFFNAMFQHNINDNHRYTVGLSGRYDDIQRALTQWDININNTNTLTYDLSSRDKVIGAYGEYTYTLDEKFSLVAGIRADYSSRSGWQIAPRANIKYSFTENTILRLNAGRGYRNPNPIVDNLGVLSSSRIVNIDQDAMEVEDAWSFGGNFTQYFRIGENKSNYISFDYFRTSFNSQIVFDWNSGWNGNSQYGTVEIYNVKDAGKSNNRSFTDTYQLDLSVEPFERFTAIATFRYNNAKVTMKEQGLVDNPLVSKYKGVLNLQYATRMNKWTFDFTAQLNGPSALPEFMSKLDDPFYAGKTQSEIYPMLYFQITKKFRLLDVYAGVENITNYKQENPIIDAQNPYSSQFNASMVWGPLMGRMFYVGMRLTLWKK